MEKNNKKGIHTKRNRVYSMLSVYVLCILTCSILGFNTFITAPMREAYALSYQSITTNGTQSNDNCISAVDDATDVWLLCNSVPTGSGNSTLSYVNPLNGQQKATFATGISFSVVDELLPLYGSSQSILLYTQSGFTKYFFDGTNIDKVGSLTLSGCTNTGQGSASYDSKGYVWYPCPTQSTVGAINPTLMTDIFRSGQILLANGFPSDCTNGINKGVSDVSVVYTTATTGLVSVMCNNPIDIMYFDISNNAGTITQLTHKNDYITLTGGAPSGVFPQLYVDGDSKRMFFNDPTNGLRTSTYTISGVTNFISTQTVEKTTFGQTGQYNCYSDFYMTSTKGHILYCAGNNVIEGFYSNSTGVFTTFNIGSYATTYSPLIRPIESYNAANFVVSTGLLNNANQNFLYITGTATTYSNPVASPPNNSNGGVPSTNFCYDSAPVGGTPNLVCYPCPAPSGSNYVCDANGFPQGAPFLKGITGSGLFYNGTQSIQNLACATGYFSCSNQNIITNGVGYWVLIILIIITTIVILYATYKTDHKPMEATFVIVLLSTLECAALWKMNFVDFTPFAIAILGVVGLAGFSIYRKVSDGD